MSSGNQHGRITTGVPADAAAHKTLEFIETHLAAWRDDPERPRAERERDLNSQLCKFLNVAARHAGFAMVHFHHEEPQGARHSADFSANPSNAGSIEGRQYTKYTPILVVEGKRLPTPGSGREREYVTSPAHEPPGGGIQRFKLGLHGEELTVAGMVGYVRERTCQDWFDAVNNWIDDLALSGNPLWSVDDKLEKFVPLSNVRTSRCQSKHGRQSGSSTIIHLVHLWVEM